MAKKVFSFILGVALAAALLGSCKSTGQTGSSDYLKLDSEIVTGSLSNGMNYFVQNNKKPSNRIVLRLVVKAGSNMEDDDQKGIAHFIEHMAFNGTENFEKNSIIDFFEEIGMNFGADLNAYTSFDETVYKLEIPADNPEYLEKALLILHDWACAVSFNQEELDKERGVITEEWRVRQLNAQGRISNQLIQKLFEGSQYASRLPIGDMNIIKNISRDRVVDFYEKWYRPELMSVVVVGDADTNTLEAAIKKAMEPIPASKKPITAPRYKVPGFDKKTIFTIQEAEQAYPLTEFYDFDTEYQPYQTKERYTELIAQEFASYIFNVRLSEITAKPESPWLAANIYTQNLTHFTLIKSIAFAPKDGMYEKAFKTLLDEYDRIETHGITQGELDFVKNLYQTQVESSYKDSVNITSVTKADQIVEYVLSGSPVLSPEDEYNITKECIDSIDLDYINNAIKNTIPDRGTVLVSLIPDYNESFPGEAKLGEIWNNYQSEEALEAYEESIPDGELMARPKKKAKVVSKNKLKELGTTEYILENGAKIYLKTTDYDVGNLSFYAISKGGNYLIKTEDYPSLAGACTAVVYSGMNGFDYMQLQKIISNKKFNLNWNVTTQNENFNGYASVADAEITLQMINLLMTRPQFTDQGWNLTKLNLETNAKDYGLKPENVFSDKVRNLVYNDPIRYESVNNDFVKMVNPEDGERIFKERFSNAADWSFVFVGDFEEKKLLDLICRYIGTIPGNPEKSEEGVYPEFKFPKGVTSETVVKGFEEEGIAFIGFGGKLPPAEDVNEIWKQQEVYTQLKALLDIKLREAIREEKSGSYNVSLTSEMDGYPERYYRMGIYFNCEPEREQELADEVIAQIKKLQNEPVSENYITKLNETYRRTIENDTKTNSWWINKIISTKILTYEPIDVVYDFDSVPAWTTPESLQEAARKYLNTDNYIQVFLKPEL